MTGAPPLDPTRRDAPRAAAHYLREAVEAIDATFGEGHAAANPELVAAMVQASAIDSAIANGRIASLEMRDAIVSLKPRLFG